MKEIQPTYDNSLHISLISLYSAVPLFTRFIRCMIYNYKLSFFKSHQKKSTKYEYVN